MNDLPEWAKDAIYLDSEHHFSMVDRIKILFGWKAIYWCGIATAELPGRTLPFTSRLSMRRPNWWPYKPIRQGYGEARMDKEAAHK